MKRLALITLLGLTALPALAQSTTPYIERSNVRTYYIDDLQSCPGILDMQTGDLWVMDFPEEITDSFITRGGIIEAKANGNRLMLAGLSSRGTVPLVVLTESGQAAQFSVRMKDGQGGRNKTVQILPGQHPTAPCRVATATLRQATSVTAPAQSAPRPEPAATPAPQPVRADPVSQRSTVIRSVPSATPPAPGNARSASAPAQSAGAFRVMPQINPATTPSQIASTRFKTPALAVNTIGAALQNGKGVRASVKIMNATAVRFEFRNTLGSPVLLNTQGLSLAGRRATEKSEIVVPAGKTVTRLVKLAPGTSTGAVSWAGQVQQTGEYLYLKGHVTP